ncbi:DNA translocase FtsK [Ornithobacterium rhinotracheale]|nr:DNA translocase FtsK [Ornithobacterium rhinotracheale]
MGLLSLFVGFVLLLSFVSYLMNWKSDQSQVGIWKDTNIEVNNLLGKMGAWLGETFIYERLGFAALFIPIWLIILGLIIVFKIKKIKFLRLTLNFLFFCVWLPPFLSLIFVNDNIWGGRMGLEIADYLKNIVGIIGFVLILFFSFLFYAIVEWKITPDKVRGAMPKMPERKVNEALEEEAAQEIASEQVGQKEEGSVRNKFTEKIPTENTFKSEKEEEEFVIKQKPKETPKPVTPVVPSFEVEQPQEPTIEDPADEFEPEIKEIIIEDDEDEFELPTSPSGATTSMPAAPVSDVKMQVENAPEEEELEPEEIGQNLVQQYGEYDQRLDLSNYKYPTIDLLIDYNQGKKRSIDQSELEANKDRIVETLSNYKINIASIKATVGPTVTLYEIVPEAGVRISKIKNLEDDIALSLSALGIRIIAPIPGRGTIGIEVPNNNPTMVAMRSVIASQKFQTAEMELPIAFGKTISNETFVADLAKMPHLLMAGATGQGKSVGINAIITSLLYKKHPSELKFVMVDPKKVELALYNKIERHFLAKLPGSEEAIITDNQKVINTLNSLCIEMDDRYDLLKNAGVRNIKEYNAKFKKRRLNPNDGHRYLPYIVLVVDEFADLIMTAGKEIEAPIARLAQLARAVGIHLIIATQRPSVNVITGMIKANFPSRAAFRVTSKIDSRTILDSGGADQLIGKGDMLYTQGNDLVRLQCAFVDTPEVESIAEFIGGQKGYPDAFLLPEYEGETSDSSLDLDPSERDALFEDAARIVVNSQQGSASMLQRKLKIGYNRAGRIIDQLEANNIVGPFEGSKAREVLIADEYTLEQLLKNE